jgi:aspartate aminotransferase
MLSKRIQNLKPSPTLALAAKARELKAKGLDVISLTVGEPDWDTYENVKKAAIKAIEAGDTKYTPSNGTPELREVIARQVSADFGVTYSPNEVTVSTGGKFVIFSALQSLLNPGDEVIIPAPYWVSYPSQVELAEGKPVLVTTQSKNRFTLQAEELERHITSKTKLLILNSPSNPTGNMYSKESLKNLARVLDKHPSVFVLSDDIYNRLVFDSASVAPHLLQVAPHLKDRLVIINGVAKSYSMTGWRLGWALGPQNLISAMTNYQSQSVSCVPGFIQKATIEAILNSEKELSDSLNKLKARKEKVHRMMLELPNVKTDNPDGAFYFWPDIKFYLGKKWKGQIIATSSEFSSRLLEYHNVAVVPGSEFGMEGFLRLSYALKDSDMEKAITRLGVFLTEFEV